MALETKLNLTKETLETVQDLVQMNIDSRDGFRHASKSIEDLALSEVFDFLADQRDQQADELSSYAALNGERPRREGSYLAALHRTWIDIRELLSSKDTVAVLEEAERGEDAIKAAYKEALQQTAGSAMTDVLNQQFALVKQSHDRIRDLRDLYKAGC